MDIQTFAKENRIRKPKADECGDMNIFGKRGSIYEHSDGLFAASIIGAPRRWWARACEDARAAGCRITQNGDREGTFLFDPTNPVQVNLAIVAIWASRKRNPSEAQLRNLLHRPDTSPLVDRKTHSEEKSTP